MTLKKKLQDLNILLLNLLVNKVDRLEKTLELVKKTLDHDKEMKLQQPKQFGKYEMT